jgi:predicted dehydrogenase
MSQHRLRRRRFLATGAAAVGAPLLIPSGVLAAPGRQGANQRLTVAHVGVGGMGGAHLGMMLKFRERGAANIAAVCEADENRLAAALKRVGPGCMPYRDYRYVLQRNDVDAVIIASPDHWHAVQTVHACESGKHVYVEKPASCTVEAGKAMAAAAGKHHRVVQVGSQARSAKPAHHACTYVRNGMLGKVTKVTCWHAPNPTGGTAAPSAPPPQLDWDLWLGPLRWRPYVPGAYCHGVFRWLMESGGGVIRDRGAHVMSIALWCMDADQQSPVSVEATGTPTTKGIWDCPPQMKVVYTFKNPDWQLIWEQPGDVRGPGGFGLVFHGDGDTLVVCRDGTRIDAEEKAQRFKVPAGGVEVYRMDKPADYNMNHKEDWIQAIMTGRKPCMDIEVGHRVATMNNLGNMSYLLGRKLRWDGVKQQVINDPQANRMLGRPQRHPYHL